MRLYAPASEGLLTTIDTNPFVAKKRRGKRRTKGFIAIPVETEVALSTVSEDNVVIADIFSGTLTEDLYMFRADLTWMLQGTLTAGEGPYGFGIAHGDYSADEIEECINVAITGPFDKINGEKARRLVRRVGRFSQLDAAAPQMQFNNGRPMKTKVRWINESGQNTAIWVENQGAGATTGKIVSVTGTIYGRWLY